LERKEEEEERKKEAELAEMYDVPEGLDDEFGPGNDNGFNLDEDVIKMISKVGRIM